MEVFMQALSQGVQTQEALGPKETFDVCNVAEDIDYVNREEQKNRRDKPVVSKQLKVLDAYVKFLINDGIPLSTSSSPHFKEFVWSWHYNPWASCHHRPPRQEVPGDDGKVEGQAGGGKEVSPDHGRMVKQEVQVIFSQHHSPHLECEEEMQWEFQTLSLQIQLTSH